MLLDITSWAFATDGTPIALSYFGILPEGVFGMLSIDFVGSDIATPLPAALPLFAGGLGVIAAMARRRRKPAA